MKFLSIILVSLFCFFNSPLTKAKTTQKNKSPSLHSSKAVSGAISSKTSIIDPTIYNQIQNDFKAALSGSVIPNVGDQTSWGGGTLTRSTDQSLHYVNNNNGHYEADLNANTDLVQLAKDNGDIRKTWVSQYGVDLGNLDANKGDYKAQSDQMNHVMTYGLAPSWNKENPWKFSYGIGAYNDNGKVVFFDKNGVKPFSEIQKTNEYKALVGANLASNNIPDNADNSNEITPKSFETPPAVPDPSYNNSVNQIDYLKKQLDSAEKMLVSATENFKQGKITKDQYISIAETASDSIKYFQANNSNTHSVPTSNPSSDPNQWMEVNQSILPKMRDDSQAYFNSTKPGDITNWAGGKLYRNENGALFVGPDGDAFYLRKPFGDFNNAALTNPNIAEIWKQQYGFKPVGETRFQNQRGFSPDSFTKNISAEINSDASTYGLKIATFVRDQYNSLSPGQSKNWNGLTLIRAGNPYCVQVLSENFNESAQFCWSDDFAKNLPNSPYGTKLATKYWGYQAP